ncbi:MAG: DUF5606 domain-containing protein [Muribaculaceae bacterium]|nr:DUF5606 domain-containing protein [Muribaculaceae bacterium]
MLRKVVSIAGKAGLYSLVSQGKNMLIVESLADGKRIPAYARDKVMSLGDIAIYTTGDDMPLGEVLDKVYAFTDAKTVDLKSFGNDKEMRDYFAQILPEYDSERVYNNDIRKLFSWYNILLGAGFTKFTQELQSAEETAEAEAKE